MHHKQNIPLFMPPHMTKKVNTKNATVNIN